MEGTSATSDPDAYKVHGLVACSKFLKGFQLKEGDQVIVHPDMAALRESCDKTNCGWSEDKEEYIISLKPEDVGTVGKRDWLGEGRRVQWCDGHWWSFPMEVLAVRLASLHPSQKQFLQDGSDEWVVWRKKLDTALQVVEINSTSGDQTSAAAEQGGSQDIVEEILNITKVVLQEALPEDDADASNGGDNDEPDDVEGDEEEDDEEDEEEDEDEDDDEVDGLPRGGRKARRRLKQAKKAASLAYNLYTWVA